MSGSAAVALAVAVGGAIGSLMRYAMSVWTAPVSAAFPWGTVAINVVGSFAIGAFATLTEGSGRHPASETARLFFMAGVCGGFTTFSAFSLQTLDLLRAGAVARAVANAVVSVVACVAAVAVGHALAVRVNGAGPVARDAGTKTHVGRVDGTR